MNLTIAVKEERVDYKTTTSGEILSGVLIDEHGMGWEVDIHKICDFTTEVRIRSIRSLLEGHYCGYWNKEGKTIEIQDYDSMIAIIKIIQCAEYEYNKYLESRSSEVNS